MTAQDPGMALFLHALAGAVVVAVILAVAARLRARSDPASAIYESGAPVRGPATLPVPAAWFQIAAFFVIFDYEAAVLYGWAVAAPAAGWTGLAVAGTFIGVLLAALGYLWADGALDTGPAARKETL